MIMGQGSAITSDTDSEPVQVSKVHQYQWCNDSPWATEGRNTLLSQALQALPDIRQDCTIILVTILKEAKVQDILQIEPEVSSNKSLYAMWKLA